MSAPKGGLRRRSGKNKFGNDMVSWRRPVLEWGIRLGTAQKCTCS